MMQLNDSGLYSTGSCLMRIYQTDALVLKSWALMKYHQHFQKYHKQKCCYTMSIFSSPLVGSLSAHGLQTAAHTFRTMTWLILYSSECDISPLAKALILTPLICPLSAGK